MKVIWIVVAACTAAAAGAFPEKAPVPDRPARLLSVQAQTSGAETLVDIVLDRTVTATLAGEPRRLQLKLPDTGIGPQLAGALRSGGMVSRIGVERAPAPARDTRLTLDLGAPAQSELVPAPARNTVRVRIVPAMRSAELTEKPPAPSGQVDVDAYQTDVGVLLKSLARDGGVSVVVAGATNARVTIDLRRTPVEKAIEMVARAAGLACRRDGGTFVIGTLKEIEAAYPVPAPVLPKPQRKEIRREVYRCKHVMAADLARSLEGAFERELLKIAPGAGPISPRLDDASTAGITGVQATTIKGGGPTAGGTGTVNSTAQSLVLIGEEDVLEKALALAARLDEKRAQVRIAVRITDISTQALKELGIRWNWSNYTVSETAASGINFGTFAHSPVSIDTALSALEKNDRSKLLAAPTLSLLDGERGFILIGERLLYPKLIGYTQAQTPIFDKAEERVGIYLQVAVHVASDGEITLSIYPQVSVVTGFLTVNGASYPQISTREQQTTIRVKPGGKIVVGGLLRDEDLHNIQRVPLLSRIPIFGELFTFRKRTRNQSELVVMITPELLKD